MIKINNKISLMICFFIILLIKILVLGVFSSDYQNHLFIPFITHFITYLNDPWQWAYQTKNLLEFPYHPLMLYTFSIGTWLITYFQISNVFLVNFLFKLPTLFADLGILLLIIKITKNPKKSLLYYFASPIIFYASYMHSQFDLVPTAFLFFSFYLLQKNRIWYAIGVLALTCSFKSTAVLFLPIFLIYVYKRTNFAKMVFALSMIILIYGAISFPFIFHNGYVQMVLFNAKQNLFFDLTVPLGNNVIYLPLLCIIAIYIDFFSYTKINNHLLNAFCCLTNSIFLTIVPPSSPAWFVWLVPFLSLFLINFSSQRRSLNMVYIFLNVMYLVYFVFCHMGDYGDLTIWKQSLDLKINNYFLLNFIYTLLVASIICFIHSVYALSVKSNAIYKKNKAILIGISGDSGSGKTTLLRDLKDLLQENLLTLEGDGAHKWWRGSKNWNKYTHLNPKANYLYNQIETLSGLKDMKTVDYRHYNHSTGTFEVIKQMRPKNFIVLAGLHAFYLPKMRKMMNLKIFLDTDEQLRMLWKEQRDIAERQYTAKAVKKISEERKADAKKYIAPQKCYADMVIRYFIDHKAKNANHNIKLRIDIDSDISLEELLTYFHQENISFQWEYSKDLKMQYLILDSGTGVQNIEYLAQSSIENLEEIIGSNFVIQKGFRGIVQFLILKIISRKMKETSYD